jgi:hypothetical protein
MISFELWNDVPTIYWLSIKVGTIPLGYIAKNVNLDDKYKLTVYRSVGSKIVNETVGEFLTVMEAKSAFSKMPIGKLLTYV